MLEHDIQEEEVEVEVEDEFSDEEDRKRYKIVMLGNSGVGKTSYLKRLLQIEPDPQYRPSILCEIFEIDANVNNETVNVFIYNITNYLVEADGAIIMVSSIDDEETIKLYKEKLFQYYKKELPTAVITPNRKKGNTIIEELILVIQQQHEE